MTVSADGSLLGPSCFASIRKRVHLSSATKGDERRATSSVHNQQSIFSGRHSLPQFKNILSHHFSAGTYTHIFGDGKKQPLDPHIVISSWATAEVGKVLRSPDRWNFLILTIQTEKFQICPLIAEKYQLSPLCRRSWYTLPGCSTLMHASDVRDSRERSRDFFRSIVTYFLTLFKLHNKVILIHYFFLTLTVACSEIFLVGLISLSRLHAGP